MNRSRSALKLKFFVVACMAALGALAVGTATASAGYQLVPSSFGSLTEVTVGVAVDNSTGASAGDVYESDLGNGTLYKFNASGEPVNYTAGPNAGSNAMSSAAGFGENKGPWAVAVDSVTGDVYATVEDPPPARVEQVQGDRRRSSASGRRVHTHTGRCRGHRRRGKGL